MFVWPQSWRIILAWSGEFPSPTFPYSVLGSNQLFIYSPDEPEITIIYDNALQLHPEGLSAPIYPYASPSTTMSGVGDSLHHYATNALSLKKPSFPRPPLTHLETSTTRYMQSQGDAASDRLDVSATDSNNTLTARPSGRVGGEDASPASASPTYLSTSPFSQDLSPLTPSTPLTSVSSPEVTTQRFQGNYSNGYSPSVVQSDAHSTFLTSRNRPMQHACSQPNLRTQAVGSYAGPQENAQYATNYYHHGLAHTGLSQPGPSVSAWTSPTQAYSPLHGTEITRLPPSPMFNTYEGYGPSDQHQSSRLNADYIPSTYSTLAGAVSLTATTTRSSTSVADAYTEHTPEQPTPMDYEEPMNVSEETMLLARPIVPRPMYPPYPASQPSDVVGSSSSSVSPIVPMQQLDVIRNNDIYRHLGSSPAQQPSVPPVFCGLPCPGPLIPQIKYRPATASDHRRYVMETDLLDPVYFTMSRRNRIGISLVDALHVRVGELDGKDDACVDNCGPSISLRLLVRYYSRLLFTCAH